MNAPLIYSVSVGTMLWTRKELQCEVDWLLELMDVALLAALNEQDNADDLGGCYDVEKQWMLEYDL